MKKWLDVAVQGKILVVDESCAAKDLVDVWKPSGSRTLADGRKVKAPRRAHKWICIISYDQFRIHSDVIVPNSRPTDLLIADEAHKLKNSKTKLLVTLSAFKSRRRVLLTGTVSFSLSICLP